MATSDNSKPAIVMAGNVFEGFKFYGPFVDWDQAAAWADSPAGPGCETLIVSLEETGASAIVVPPDSLYQCLDRTHFTGPDGDDLKMSYGEWREFLKEHQSAFADRASELAHGWMDEWMATRS